MVYGTGDGMKKLNVLSGRATGTGSRDFLDMPVESLNGVGPKIAKILRKRGIAVIEDLFYFLPARYTDRRHIRNIRDVVEGEGNVVVGRVVEAATGYSRASRKRMCWAVVEDGTGALTVKWFRFHKNWMSTVCRKGNRLFLSGTVTRFGRQLQMVHPHVALLDEGTETGGLQAIMPVYPEVEGLKQGVIRKIIEGAFECAPPEIASVIPPRLEASNRLPGLKEALLRCHFPEEWPENKGKAYSWRARLVLEEFFLFQALLFMKRAENRKRQGVSLKPGAIYKRFLISIPFALTPGQQRVRAEIERDMAGPEPMNRLLQGDVGCGKTICAILAACIALDNGHQVAFMAPTEILAEQHYLTVRRMFEKMGIEVVLLRGNMGPARRHVAARISSGGTHVVVGTHAMLERDVVFAKLGLIVIDEQHRFGVNQRRMMRDKAYDPHVLVMSATPIPRTLSMVVYGDLDVSAITEMPAIRSGVTTRVVTDGEREEVYRQIRDEVGKGRQAFIVYPLVEESEKLDLMAAKERVVYLRKHVFPFLEVGLLHGRMKADEKERTMSDFKEGKIHILVCTTVIEVGIDVPKATIMVVEHADRFGLSQLHQLRGRVGRGGIPGTCFLFHSGEGTSTGTRRLRVLEKTGDGFVIAEEDMKLRGPGDMFGVRQAGIPDFRVGNLMSDATLMGRARRMAEEAVATSDGPELERLKRAIAGKWGGSIYLGDTL